MQLINKPTSLQKSLSWFALLIAASLTPLVFCTYFFDSYNLVKDTFSLLIIYGVVVFLLIPMWSEKKWYLQRNLLFPALGVWLSIQILSIIVAVNRWDSFMELIQNVAYVLGVILTAHALVDKTQLKWALRFLSLSGLLVAAYGVGQYFGFEPFQIGANFDAISSMGHRNFAAQVIILLLPISAVLIVLDPELLWKGIGGLGILLQSLHLLISHCRGAWVGSFLATGAVVAFLGLIELKKPDSNIRSYLKRSIQIAAVLLVLFLIVAVSTGVGQRFMSIFSMKVGTNMFRLLAWKGTLKMVADHPVLGVGLENFKQYIPRYRDPEEWKFSGVHSLVNRAHNEYIQMLAEGGPLFLIAFLIVIYFIMKSAWQVFEHHEDNTIRLSGLAFGWGCAATLGHSFFSFNLHNSASALLFWFSVGAIAAMANPCFDKGLTKVKVEQTSKKKKKRSAKPDAPTYKIKRDDSHWWKIESSGWRHLFTAIILIFCLAAVIYQFRLLISDYYLKRGKAAEQRNLWPYAIAEYERSVSWYPYNYMTYYYLAYAYGNAGQIQKSIETTENCIALHPNYRNGYFNLGVLYEKMGDYNQALSFYRKSLEIDPRFYSPLNNINVILQKQQEFDEAIKVVKEALKYYPHSPDAHNNLGVLYYFQKDYDKALAQFQRVLKEMRLIVFPPSAINFFAYAGVASGRVAPRDRHGNIIKQWGWSDWGHFQFTLKEDGPPQLDNPPTHYKVVLDKENWEYSVVFDEVPGVYAWSIEYIIRGVEQHFEHAINAPVFAKAANNIGVIYDDLEEYDKAVTYYNKAISIDKMYEKPYARLIGLYVNKTKAYHKAIPYLEEIIKITTPEKRQEYEKVLHDIRNAMESTPTPESP